MTTKQPSKAKRTGERRAHGTGHVFERNGAVHVKFRPVPGRPPVQRKICRIGELSETAIERKRAKIEGNYKPPKKGDKPTVTQTANRYVEKLKVEDAAKSYWEGREGCIETHLEDTPLGDMAVDLVMPEDIRNAYRKMKANGVGPSVIQSFHWLLSATFKQSIEEEHRTTNPINAVATPKYSTEDEIRPLTTEEIDRVIAAAPDDDLGRLEKPLYRVAQHTGMRRGELLALRIMDCQFELASIDIRKNYVAGEMKDTKGHESRTLPMTPTAKRMILEVLAARSDFKDPEDLVFTLTGEPLSPEKVSKRFKAALLKAKVGPVEMRLYKTSRGKSKLKPFPKLKLHQLRDTFASHNMSNPTVAPVEVQNGLGHKDLSTTSNRYGKYIPQVDTAERFEASFNRPSADTQFDPQNAGQGSELVAEDGIVRAQ